MQAGTHPDMQKEAVHELTCWALLGGVRREIARLSLARETNDLPLDTSGGSGILAATCEITWAEQPEQVQEIPATPWRRINSWPPVSEQPVEIWAQYVGYAPYQLFTGYIEGANVEVYDGLITSSANDNSRRLDNTIEQDALLRMMPSWEDHRASMPMSSTNPEAQKRHINLSQGYVVDRALRRCGFGGIPMPGPATRISVPMVGSTWPEVGELWRNPDSLGLMAGHERTQLQNRGGQVLWRADGPRVDEGRDAYIYVEIANITSGIQAITMWGCAIDVKVGYNPVTKLVFCDLLRNGGSLRITKQAGVNFLIVKATRDPGGVRYTLRHGTAEQAGVQPAKIDGDDRQVWARMEPNTTSGGIYLEIGTASWPVVRPWQKSIATFNDKDLVGTPALVGKSTRELLREWAAGTLNFLYADEFGGIRAVEYKETAPVTLIPTQIEKMVAQTTYAGVRSRVDVLWREPLVQSGGYIDKWGMAIPGKPMAQGELPTAFLWRGNVRTFKRDEESVDLIHPAQNEDWVVPWLAAVDIGFTPWPVPSDLGYWNWREPMYWQGPSILGGVAGNEAVQELWVGGYLQKNFARIDPQTWRVWHKYTPPPGDDRDARTVFADIPEVPPHLRNTSCTCLNGWGKITWRDMVATGVNRGPDTARVKEHDAGWWVQHGGDAQAIADKLSAYTAGVTPSLPTLDIAADLRLQLLDTVRILDEPNGIDVTGFLTKISLDIEAGDARMSVGVRPTKQKMTYTLGDQDATFAGDSLWFYDDVNRNRNLGAMDTDPLRRTP